MGTEGLAYARPPSLFCMDAGATTGIRTDFTYDLAGNILTQRVGYSVAGQQSVTTFAYDNRGHLTRVTDALGRAETFTYDQNSHLLTHTDRNGTQFRYTYDNMGRVTQVQAWRGSVLQTTRSYSFFHTGALYRKIAGTSQLSFEYDAQGRVRRKLDNHGNINSYVYVRRGTVLRRGTQGDGSLGTLCKASKYRHSQSSAFLY